MGRKYYHMFFSILLVILPTIGMNIVLVNTLKVEVYTPMLLLLYYLFLFSTVVLFLAGATDPGIMERNLVKDLI